MCGRCAVGMRASTCVWLVCSLLVYKLDVCGRRADSMRVSTCVWLVCSLLVYKLNVCGRRAVSMRASTRVWLVCSLLVYQCDVCGRCATHTCADYMYMHACTWQMCMVAVKLCSHDMLVLHVSILCTRCCMCAA